jgi:hypothetical protein
LKEDTDLSISLLETKLNVDAFNDFCKKLNILAKEKLSVYVSDPEVQAYLLENSLEEFLGIDLDDEVCVQIRPIPSWYLRFLGIDLVLDLDLNLTWS